MRGIYRDLLWDKLEYNEDKTLTSLSLNNHVKVRAGMQEDKGHAGRAMYTAGVGQMSRGWEGTKKGWMEGGEETDSQIEEKEGEKDMATIKEWEEEDTPRDRK